MVRDGLIEERDRREGDERKYGLTSKSAWFMMHRIREAMRREPMAGLLTARVVVDETYIGGTPKNRHGHDPKTNVQGPTDKTPVVALVSRDTGEGRSMVLANVTGENLHAAIRDEVEPERTVLHTDGSFRYPRIAHHYAGHSYVRSPGARVRARRRFDQPGREFLLAAQALD